MIPLVPRIALALVAASPTALAFQDQEVPPSAPTLEVVQAYFPFHRQAEYPAQEMSFADFTHVAHAFLWPRADGSLERAEDFLDPTVNQAVHAGGAKILASIGGHANSSNFATLAASAAARQRFVTQVSFLVSQHDYDGIELHWLFPSSAQERDDLQRLVADLRQTLGGDKQINVALPLTASLGQWFDPRLVEDVDFFPLLGFNLHGSWDGSPLHNAPLNESRFAPRIHIEEGVNGWLKRGFPASKLILGLPFFGRSFDPESPANEAGYIDATAGTYREIRGLIGRGYHRRWDAKAQVPYLVADQGSRLWSYDDAQSLGLKVEFARRRSLGGVMIWEITQDLVDGEHTLLPAVLERLR